MTNRLGLAAFVATTYLFPPFRMLVTSVSQYSPAISLNHPAGARIAEVPIPVPTKIDLYDDTSQLGLNLDLKHPLISKS